MKRSLLIFMLLCLLFGASTGHATNVTPRIIGGNDTQITNWPFMVSIHFPFTSGGHGCGGSLIHPNWVLTAAHCVDGESPEDIQVLVGLTQQSNPTQATQIAVRSFVQHPFYDSGRADSVSKQPLCSLSVGNRPAAGNRPCLPLLLLAQGLTCFRNLSGYL